MQQSSDSIKRTMTGVVSSDKMNKTCVVKITNKVKHALGKFVIRTTKLHVHDEENTAREGDKVLIQESRPYSKRTAWKLVKVVEKAITD